MALSSSAALHARIKACRLCAAHLSAGPRPVVQFAPSARLLIISQAPGAKVHASGIPWDDDSGRRLRDWLGIAPDCFYDPTQVALMPMGFCYPGKGASGDLPPRPECAPAWHDQLLAELPNVALILLVGIYAQARYLPGARRLSMSERVRRYRHGHGHYRPLPHPSWRSTMWMRNNPWYERELLPQLRAEVEHVLRPGITHE